MTAGGRAGSPFSLLDRLFPAACVICGEALPPADPPLCRRCGLRLPAMAPPHCRRCGATATACGARSGCGECSDWDEEAPPCRTPYRMEGRAARVVRALKYGGWTRLAEVMARTMEPDARRLAGDQPAVLVPVPLSPARLRERGFNQAELLAESLSQLTGWTNRPYLRRESGGRSQAGSGRAARQSNVSEVFHAAGDVPARVRILLVDDVVTTGATIRACAGALVGTRAQIVGGVAFARTLPPIHGA